MGGYGSYAFSNNTPNLLTDPGTDFSRFFGNTSNLLTDPGTDFSKFFSGPAQASATQYFSPGASQKTPGTANASTIKGLGALTSIFSGINAAIGQFYAAKTQQYQQQSQASQLQFQSGMEAINAHNAEMNAQSIMEDARTQVQQYTMRAGQQQAASTAATAARGIDLSSESAIDQRASDDLMKQLGVLTINANATRAAWAQRTQATADSNQSLLDSVSASNMQNLANTISPGLALTRSLAGSATSIASKWDWRLSSVG